MKPPPSLAPYAQRGDLSAPKDSDLVKWRSLRAMAARLLGLIPEAGSGLAVVGTNDGPRLILAPGTGTWHNFQPYNVTPGSCQVSDGTLSVFGDSLRRPTIGGVALNAATPPTLTLDDNAPNYVYLVLHLTSVTSSGYVLSSTIDSPKADNCTIEAFTSEQTSTATTVYLPLFQITGGVVGVKTQFSNISLRAFDDGTATSTPVYVTW